MTNNASNEKYSATYQVLYSPLLLEQILTWISEDTNGYWPRPEAPKKPQALNSTSNLNPNSDDDSDYDPTKYIESGGVLLRCALVNKHWFHESTRILWRHWKDQNLCRSVLTETFAKMKLDRRQFYANMINRADLLLIGEYIACQVTQSITLSGEQRACQVVRSIFEDITFPNLRAVHLTVPGHFDKRVEIPIFRAPRLKTLLLDPEYDWLPVSYSVSQDQWKMLFELIVDRFPDLENIEFEDQAKVWPGEIQKLRDRLCHLKNLNVWGVEESTVIGRGL
ncbi:uncharacterized protein N7458_006236 [Penicillium daleae]|uniref:Uncharacterized protein n=1 Tax=Penicillium daleae TaxID=63821 RepID=A0AAD6G1J3_9EURO|nr:uncharacterized protein N7458_006236 [Penicillium daleae]KAJ5449787.1 hypothetical protein N7458_006236 [Penicillium daleae]